MKTSSYVTLLYLTSISVVMSGENIISAGCKDLLLKLFEDLKFNWIVYAANFLAVVYIVSLAIRESERNTKEEDCQKTNSSPEPNQSQRNNSKPNVRSTLGKLGNEESASEESCTSTDDDSGISTTACKEKNTSEEKRFLLPQDLERERRYEYLVSEIQNILYGEHKDRDLDKDKVLTESDSLLDLSPLTSHEDVYSTPKQSRDNDHVTMMSWSESSCEVSEADISTDKLETIEEESSWKSEHDSQLNRRKDSPEINSNYDIMMNWSESSCEVSEADISTDKLEKIEEESSWKSEHDSQPKCQENNSETNVDLLLQNESVSKSIPSDKSSFQLDGVDSEHQGHPQYTFREPFNLLMTKDEQHKQHKGIRSAQAKTSHSGEAQNCKELENGSEADGNKGEEDTKDGTLDSNFSITDSFADLMSKFSPDSFNFEKRTNDSATHCMSPGNPNNDSVFNTTFSVSSLEDILSPETRHGPTASPHRIPLDQSLGDCNPRFLGIRLHKPAGVNDVFLSIVSIDEEKGLDTVSETWTLGNREDMELILSIETNPDLPSSKQYSGRYSLVFDNNNNDSLAMDSTGSVSRENSFLHSFLREKSLNETPRDEEESLGRASEDNFNKLSTSAFGRLVMRAASARQTDRNSQFHDSIKDDALEETYGEEYNEVGNGGEEISELYESINSTSAEIVTTLRDISRDWLNDEHLRHTAMATGCVVLTCYVLYRSF